MATRSGWSSVLARAPALRLSMAAVLLCLFFPSAAHAADPCGYAAWKIMREITNPHDNNVIMVAHRGLHALDHETAYENTPENSKGAIKAAVENCYEVIELDVRLASDGVPVLSHDFRWGRELAIASNGCQPSNSEYTCYNPFTGNGYNPLISEVSSQTVKNSKLRKQNWKETSDQSGLTLDEALKYVSSNGWQRVIALDVKDAASVRAAAGVVAANGMTESVFFKVAARDFKRPEDFYNVLSTDYQRATVRVMPVYNTGDIAPGVFSQGGGESGIFWSVDAWANYHLGWSYRNVVGMEFNQKDHYGILDTAGFRARDIAQNRFSIANFNPRYEHISPDGKYEYYDSSGKCCNQLSKFYFDGAPYGLPSDTIDRRSQWDFMMSAHGVQKLDMITTDNVARVEYNLYERGLRHPEYYKN